MNVIEARIGETLSWDCVFETLSSLGVATATDLTGWTVAAKARRSVGDSTVIATLTTTVAVGTAGVFTISALAATTAAWTAGGLVVDVKFTSPSGGVTYTEPLALRVVQSVTR